MRRTMLIGGLLGLSALVLSGCMGPTYGTDTPAGEQLLQDVTGALTLAPNRSEPIAYRPRPELVRPASTTVLPTPQDSAASSENPAWPESPEQRLARIRAEATENQDNISYRSPVHSATAPRNQGIVSAARIGERGNFEDNSTLTTGSGQVRERAAMARQGDPQTRRFLSEPPLEYRRPAETAPAGELGEDEWRKERRIQRASGSRGWRDLVPWL
jgi:hypothetical protein